MLLLVQLSQSSNLRKRLTFCSCWLTPLTATLRLPSLPDVHSDDHPDHLHEPQCLGRTWHALHAEGVHHYLPPGAERAEAEAQLQGRGHGCHNVIASIPEAQREAQRRGKD